nr:unnamed protein product [Callosobruchus chinensis]
MKNMHWLRRQIYDEDLENSYKSLKNEVSAQIKNEKTAYYESLINNSTNKSKTVWNVVNHTIGRKKRKSISEIYYNNELILDPNRIANAFGEYLSTVIDDKMKAYFHVLSDSCSSNKVPAPQSMFFNPVLPNEVFTVITALPNKKSTGPDEVPVSVIKANVDILSPKLAELINTSVMSGTFPKALKLASTLVIFKKGDALNPENYRPIAILSVFSKIIEKMVALRIENYLTKYDILSPSQHGFRAGRSTETGVVEYMQHINNELDVGKYVVSIMFDLSRAFDTVNISFVSKKIEKIGIRGCLNDWVTSFLKHRHFFVKIGNEKSNEFYSNWGTPQGSVLGPLIFLIFINDLPQYLSHGRIFLYADDTNIVVSDCSKSGLMDKIDIVTNEFISWCEKNSLIINSSKTVLLEFYLLPKIPAGPTLSCFGSLIEPSATTTFLGVTIDSHISWHAQIQTVCKKLQKSYFAINTLKNNFNTSSLLEVYYALMYSAISYCIITWGQCSEVHRVFVLQKRILRLIFRLPYNSSCRELFKKQLILTVPSIYLLKILCYIFMNKHTFVKHSDIHGYGTRNKNKIVIQKFHHTFHSKSPIHAGCHFFNLLPSEWRNLNSFNAFKLKVKRLLLDEAFYSVHEFVNHFSSAN